ncbi:MAG: hypothetical protein ACRCRP_02380 [Metamycoplasmataceae bacterium]
MNKKSIFLSGGFLLSAIIVPLAAVTSCSNDNTNVQYINITPKFEIKDNILQSEITSNPIAITTLEKVFEGVTKDNYNQFTSSWDAKNNKIILTAKEGYKFGNINSEKNTIESIQIKITTTITYINVLPKGNITVNIKEKDLIETIIPEQTLTNIFDGITNENFSQFTSSWDPKTKKVTLMAKDGYKFGSVNSEQDKIESIPVPKIILDIYPNRDININGITQAELEAKPITKETLMKAFVGITNENFDNFTASYIAVPNPDKENLFIFSLLAKEGYLFDNNKQELPSLSFKVTTFLNITPKATITEVINSNEVTANPISQKTLEKAFDGITNQNFNNFTSSWNATTKKIILTVKEGYQFGNVTSPLDKIESIEIKTTPTPTITYINVLPKTSITVNIKEKDLIENIISKQTLDNLFDGITDTNYAQFTSSWDPKTKKVTLTAKNGYKFGSVNSEQDKIESLPIPTIILNISQKANIDSNSITQTELEAKPIKKETLMKAFDGITDANYSFFTSSWDSTNKIITLTANNGYKFDSAGTETDKIESIVISTITLLNITSKTLITDTISLDELNASPISQKTLEKVFDGITNTNYNQFTAQYNNTNKIITLTAKPGYKFGSAGAEKDIIDSVSISSTITLLNITAKTSISEAISSDELTDPILMVTLNKIFDGVTSANYSQFTSLYDSTTQILTLTAKEGYKFGTILASSKDTLASIQLNPTLSKIGIIPKGAIVGNIFESEITGTISIETLEKAFDGKIQRFYNQFTSKYDFTSKKIVLTPEKGFEFINSTSTNKTIESAAIPQIILNISPKKINEIFSNQEVKANPITKETLAKAFDGVNDINIQYFDSKATVVPGQSTYIIELIAKSGFAFIKNGANGPEVVNQIVSLSFNIASADIGVTARTKLTFDITTKELVGEISKSTLDKAFEGITNESFQKFTSSWDGQTNTIILTAKDNYSFANSAKTLSSIEITPVTTEVIVYMAITTKNITPDSISQDEVDTNPIRQLTLAKAFDGINDVNFDQFTSSWDATTGQITLTAKAGYKFGTSSAPKDTIVSNKITPATSYIGITAKNAIVGNIFENEIDGVISIETLAKAFNGKLDRFFHSFTSKYDVTNKKFILTAKAGYMFRYNDGTTNKDAAFIESAVIPQILLNITWNRNVNNNGITQAEITAAKITKETLMKAFDGITDTNINYFDSEAEKVIVENKEFYIIKLTAKSGFKFVITNGSEIVDQIISLSFEVKKIK